MQRDLDAAQMCVWLLLMLSDDSKRLHVNQRLSSADCVLHYELDICVCVVCRWCLVVYVISIVES